MAKLAVALSLTLLLQACAAVVVAGGASAVTSASDRRTLGSQIDDSSIVVKAERALEGNKTLEEKAHINVNSYNGILLLTGQAPTQDMVDTAGQLVQGIQGVKDVQNQIRIGNPISFTTRSRDSWITTRVKSLLIADKEVSALDIKVITESGEVFLMGLVSSSEADKAVEIARHVNGVARVIKAFETSYN
ncbi:MAG: divisome-associated lipoprotein YraP [Gammaproteobacteria bacterium]|nr:divisome-associated lipoprotein YraP [Gammaproteobacteria bacterium]MBU2178778.1 divisome-associated lipoprotein YraP [Gammaproteobacteria bacterium]MBU2225365.1 divisome-associated lipoprotein YraP [Gammaproteobacteria bacterium]MBU2277431.1 divisome-associated lipoprotein YraP [Gammaproteobacteria bacterium]MBU2425334.1 divisome-associated lipoprotein YraP [Gammaproteobacteria bacterium]